MSDLYGRLADAYSLPSRGYRDLEEALGAVQAIDAGFQAYDKRGEDKRIRERRKMRLEDILGPEQRITNLTSEDKDLFPLVQTLIPKQRSVDQGPKSLDAYLTQQILEGKMTADDAFDLKNSGPLLRSGYAKGPGQSLIPVQGGKPAREIAEVEVAKANARKNTLDATGVALKALNDAIPMVSGFSAGFGGLTAGIPLAPATNLQKTLDPARAIIGFGELQKLRDASPTGGALGQVSERENLYLQSLKGSLDQIQDPKLLRDTLVRIKDSFEKQNLVIEGYTGDPEADAAVAAIVDSNLSFNEKKARILGIKSEAMQNGQVR